VLVISQLLACPFLIGAVLLPPDPWAFLCLLPAYVVGEVWIGVCLAVVIELVPTRLVAVAVAFFLFVINNVGSSLPLLIPPLAARINLRHTLLLLFPGSYFLAASLFAVTMVVVRSSRCCEVDTKWKRDMERESFIIQEAEEPSFSINQGEILESQETLIVAPKARKKSFLTAD
jgi:hypothetical protein